MPEDDDNEPTLRIETNYSALLAADSKTAIDFEDDDGANTEVDLT